MKIGGVTLLLYLLPGAFVLAQPAALGQNQLNHGAMNMTAPIKSELNFIQGMIPHHQEAVDSALVVEKHSKHAQLRAFAGAVVRVQQRQISEMRGWLRAWYPKRAKAASPYQPMMRALPDATPDEADRAFIEDMMTHHETAIAMAREFLAGSFKKHPKAEALARAIVKTQAAEVVTLRGWLRSWYGVNVGATTDTYGTDVYGRTHQ